MEKTNNKNVGIIGLGYVGLPLAIEFSKVKYDFAMEIFLGWNFIN